MISPPEPRSQGLARAANVGSPASSANLGSRAIRFVSRVDVGRPALDAGLLAIRVGIGLSFVLLLALKPADATKFFAKATGTIAAGHLWPANIFPIAAFFMMFGLFTRVVAAVSALTCLCAAYAALHLGLDWFVLPVCLAEYVFLFTTLVITGPGKFSLDYLRNPH
jgi:uncharacterized membrane protein YphA (DoxX/SURF4 family)